MESMGSLDEAKFMVALFASVGSRYFDITVTNVDQEKVSFRAGRTEQGLLLMLPFLLEECGRRRENLIVRPERPRHGLLAQLDDLDEPRLDRVAPRGFLSLQTSPGNYQTWMAIEDGNEKLIRRLVQGVGADLKASQSVRIAGSLNCKRKYAPDFPRVRIEDSFMGHRVKACDLEDLLAAEPVPAPPSPVRRFWSGRRDRGWPDYQAVLRGAPANKAGEPDGSAADFLWCKWALEREHSAADVEAELERVSEKARKELKDGNTKYVRNTVTNVLKKAFGVTREEY